MSAGSATPGERRLLRHFLAAIAYRTQGPLADTMTHVGQLAMLRRLARSPVPPRASFTRIEHVLVYDEGRDVVVLFGGRTAAGPSADLWERDDGGWIRVR